MRVSDEDLKSIMINNQRSLFYSPIEPFIKLFIEPFYTCNYDCSYCYLGKKSKNELNLKKLIWFLEKKFMPAINNNILNYLDLKNKRIEIILVGGEISIKSLEWHFELYENIIKIFSEYFDTIKFSFLTNYFRPVDYYKKINNKIKELSKEFNKEITINFCATLHEEFDNLENMINKVYESSYIENMNMCLHIFKSEKELLEILDDDLKEKLKYLDNRDVLHLKTIDDSIYRDFIRHNREEIRPVKCYAYNYKIRPDFTIYQRCNHQVFTEFNFKPKLYYFCDKICACASDEGNFKKVMLLKEKKEENESG